MSIKKVLKSIPWIAVFLALILMPAVEAASMEPCCRSDKSAQAMAEQIRDQISYGEFDPYLIKVQVRGGVATLSGIQPEGIVVVASSGVVGLSGSLPSFRAVDRVLANTLMVKGVREVRSTLKVAGKPYPRDKFKIH